LDVEVFISGTGASSISSAGHGVEGESKKEKKRFAYGSSEGRRVVGGDKVT